MKTRLMSLLILASIACFSSLSSAQVAKCQVTKKVVYQTPTSYDPVVKDISALKQNQPILFIDEALYTGGDSPEVAITAYWQESDQLLELSICLLGVNSCASTTVPVGGKGHVTYEESKRQRLDLACELSR